MEHPKPDALVRACLSGSLANVQARIQEDSHAVKREGPSNRTALHAAAHKGKAACVRLLIDAGAVVNAKDSLWVTPLHFACVNGSDECVEVLLNHGADPGSRDKTSYTTPLHVAAGFGHLEVCQKLVSNSAMPQSTDRQARQPIHLAAYNGYEDVVSFLLGAVPTPPTKDRGGRLPMHWAAFRGHVPVINALLDHIPAPMDKWRAVAVKDKAGCTPVHSAAASGSFMAIKTLVSHNDAVSLIKDANGRLPLHYAATQGHTECAETLLDASPAEIDAQDNRGQTALHKAAAAGYSELVEELLDRGADSLIQDSKGRTAAFLACRSGDLETLSCILGRSKDAAKVADNRGNSLVHCAARHGHLPLLQYLHLGKFATLADLCAPGERGLTPMHLAALHGHVGAVKHLAELPDLPAPGVNAPDNDKRTPLLYAALRGHCGTAEALVAAGASCIAVDTFGRTALHYAASCGAASLCSTLGGTTPAAFAIQADLDGRTPLHYAAASKDCESVKFFLGKGGAAAVLAGDKEGRTPFHFAGWFGNPEAVDWMIEELRGNGDLGAAINQTDQLGRTAVHYAARQGLLDTLEALLRTEGASPDIKDTIGRTALDAAAQIGAAEACNVLIEHGASINVNDLTGRTPLMAAAASGHENVLDALFGDDEVEVDCHATDRTTGRTALMLAVTAFSPSCVSMLLENDASDINRQDSLGFTALQLAVLLADDPDADGEVLELIREELGSHGVDISLVDGRKRSLAHIAAMSGAADILQSLGENEQELNVLDAVGHTPMDYACYFGKEDCVSTLLSDEEFEPFNEKSNLFGPLHCAALRGHSDCIETFVASISDTPVSINAVDGCGNTALHLAAAGGFAECVAALVEADGIDVTLADGSGRTAVMLSAAKGHACVCSLLIDAGAPYDAVDEEGRNCCHLSFLVGSGEGAEAVLRSVGDQSELNHKSAAEFFSTAKTASGQAVAHLAAAKHDIASLRYLKDVGVDLSEPDAEGNPPIIHLLSDEVGRECLQLLMGSGDDGSQDSDGGDENAGGKDDTTFA